MAGLKSISKFLNRLQQPDIIFEPALCSRVRWKNSRCNLCVEGCALGALEFTPHLKLAEEKCTNCGLCISRCPNGVFWSRRRGDSALAQGISQVLSEKSTAVVEFGCACSSEVDGDTIILPCLGRLTENLLLAPLASGVERVEVWRPDCAGCAREKHLTHLETVLLLGRKLAAMVGREEDCIQVKKIGRYCEPRRAASPGFSRRGFCRQVGDEARQMMADFLPEFGNSTPTTRPAHIVAPKRRYLLKLVRGFSHCESVVMDRKGTALAEVGICPGCAGCTVCTTLCPTGALERIENNEKVDICFRPEICTGCEICQDACLFKAVSLCSTFNIQRLAARERRLLVRLTKRDCRECAREFLGVDEEICPACSLKRKALTSVSVEKTCQGIA